MQFNRFNYQTAHKDVNQQQMTLIVHLNASVKQPHTVIYIIVKHLNMLMYLYLFVFCMGVCLLCLLCLIL